MQMMLLNKDAMFLNALVYWNTFIYMQDSRRHSDYNCVMTEIFIR